jgi:type III polyketide synthase
MCLLKRGSGGMGGLGRSGIETPPETESEGDGGSDADVDEGSEGEEQGGGGEKGGLKKSGRDEREAFISEALEGVELD